MSQRTEDINKEFEVTLKLKVTLLSFSNHNGFNEKQLSNAIEEFGEEIEKELKKSVMDDYVQSEFLQSVDFVTYSVE